MAVNPDLAAKHGPKHGNLSLHGTHKLDSNPLGGGGAGMGHRQWHGTWGLPQYATEGGQFHTGPRPPAQVRQVTYGHAGATSPR